jgi:ubiquinone/menaquinone biosynthesis C-methylase UbiE
MDKLLTNSEFYDEISSEYDDMISFNYAVSSRKDLLKKFINEKTKTVADIGCGSGVDSIALALSGLKVVAFDPSSEMLKVAASNSKKMNVNLDFHNYAADKIPNDFDNKFNLVISLGNTFANISEDSFLDSLMRCADILEPEGQLLIQILNYNKILEEKERIINITESSDKIFVRFYDIYNKRVVFNILTFNKGDFTNRKLSSTQIYTHFLEKFKSGLSSLDFASTKSFGDLKLSEYIPNLSQNLVILAKKK